MQFKLELFLGLVAFWLVFLTIIHRLEKRMVWPYGDLRSQPHFEDATGYVQRWFSDAIRNGFKLLGWTHDLKGEIYRVSYAMLVSSDRSTFAVIGAGTVAKMRVQGTWLHTPTSDGRSFYSTDKQAGVKIDLSHNWTNELVLVGNFETLWQTHQAWVRENGVVPRGFREDREMEEFRALREEHYRLMEQAGLICFIDPIRTRFQYTFVGAARTAMWSYALGLMRGLTHGRFPRNA